MRLLKSVFFDEAFTDIIRQKTIGKITDNNGYWYRGINGNNIKKYVDNWRNMYWL